MNIAQRTGCEIHMQYGRAIGREDGVHNHQPIADRELRARELPGNMKLGFFGAIRMSEVAGLAERKHRFALRTGRGNRDGTGCDRAKLDPEIAVDAGGEAEADRHPGGVTQCDVLTVAQGLLRAVQFSAPDLEDGTRPSAGGHVDVERVVPGIGVLSAVEREEASGVTERGVVRHNFLCAGGVRTSNAITRTAAACSAVKAGGVLPAASGEWTGGSIEEPLCIDAVSRLRSQV